MSTNPDPQCRSRLLILLQNKNFFLSAKWLTYFVLIGFIAGLAAICFQLLCSLGSFFFLDYLAGYRPVTASGEPELLQAADTQFNRWILLFMPALGGLLSGWLVYTFAPETGGGGTDAALHAYHQTGSQVRSRVPLIKALASTVTITSGGSGGREGPIVQIGAGLGSLLARKLNLSVRERRIMFAAGIGAGVGSIFRVPFAGALFAAEVLYRDPELEADVIIPTGIATVVSYCMFCMTFGWGTLFSAPETGFSNPWELGPYTVLAVVLVGFGFIYVRTFYKVHGLFSQLSIPVHLKPALGGLLTGIVGFFLPQTLSFGYGIIQQGLFGEVGILLLLGVALGKILTTSFSLGSGGSGGLFGPAVVIGGALGGAVGQAFQHIAPHIAPAAGAMVIVGIAGFFTAVSNTPISTIIFVSEMTGSYYLLLPSFLVCLLCYFFSRNWNIFHEQVQNKAASPAHSGEFFVNVLQSYKVQDIKHLMQQVQPVPEDMTFAEFKDFYSSTSQEYFPVLNDAGELSGIFSSNDFRSVLFAPHIEDLVLVKDMATKDIISTQPEEDLHLVMNKFTRKNLDSIPVVVRDNPKKLLGMLRRKEVIAFYNQKVQELSQDQPAAGRSA